MTADLQTPAPSAADPDPQTQPAQSPDAASQPEVDELLVEEVSIDGLCGVY
ncbi:MAG: mycofactocin precursor MftA [Dermatophilaceae bacterium]